MVVDPQDVYGAVFVANIRGEKSVLFGKLPSFGRERATPGFGPAIAGLPSAPSVSLFGVRLSYPFLQWNVPSISLR